MRREASLRRGDEHLAGSAVCAEAWAILPSARRVGLEGKRDSRAVKRRCAGAGGDRDSQGKNERSCKIVSPATVRVRGLSPGEGYDFFVVGEDEARNISPPAFDPRVQAPAVPTGQAGHADMPVCPAGCLLAKPIDARSGGVVMAEPLSRRVAACRGDRRGARSGR